MYYFCIYDYKYVFCCKFFCIFYVERYLNILNMILYICDYILVKSCMVWYKILKVCFYYNIGFVWYDYRVRVLLY